MIKAYFIEKFVIKGQKNKFNDFYQEKIYIM